MEFNWEIIYIDHKPSDLKVTERAKIYGGWIVKNSSWVEGSVEGSNEAISECMVFVPDINHQWVFTEEIPHNEI